MAKILITGGAGFIGSHLCEALLQNGHKVTVLDDLSTGTRSNLKNSVKNKNFTFRKGSILDEQVMQRLVRNNDLVYHLAAAVGVKFILENPLKSILTNIEGTYITLKSACKYHKKLILASTSEIYGKHVCSPIREEDDRILGSTSIGRWSYSEAKAMDEFLTLAYAKERKLKALIVRFFNIVGPRQTGRYGMVLPRFVQMALEDKPITIYGDGLQTRTFTHVKDAVYAVVALSLNKKCEGQAFNIGSAQTISIKDLARKIKKITGSDSRIRHLSYKKAFKEHSSDFEDMLCRTPDISKVKDFIRYKPRFTIDDIIQDTVNYFKRSATKIRKKS